MWKIRGGMQDESIDYKGERVVLDPKMRARECVCLSFLSHGTLGSVQRDETASRGPASTWEGIPFGISLEWTMLKEGHGSQVTHSVREWMLHREPHPQMEIISRGSSSG